MIINYKMRTQHHSPEPKAVKISRGNRRLKPCLVRITRHGTLGAPRMTDPRFTPAIAEELHADNVFNEDSSDDEKCRVLRIYEEEDREVSSDEDLFFNGNLEGTTAEFPIDLTQSDESSDEEVDDEV